jgi:hemolysin activation/secretion protein
MERGKGARGLAARRRSSVPAARPERIPPSSQSDAQARIARPIVVAMLSLASAVAIGQQRPDAGQILEQQTREPLRLPPPPDDDVRPRPPDPKPALPVSPTLKIQVTKFTFSGNTLYSDAELAEVVKEFVGKELDFEGLNDAANKVRAHHRSRGYFLAQAYLPQQAIRNGVVEIAVIEGRVGEVELQRRPATRLREGLLAGILRHHLKPGDIITETSLEKPLLLINDLPTASVTSEIRPSQTIGAADLRVNVDQGVGLLNGDIEIDNHGSRFTGAERLGGSLNVNNPLTIGDQLQLRGFVTTEDMYFERFAYLVPVGFWGTRLGASYTRFSYKLGEEFASLLASGDGVVKSVYAFHPLYRTRTTNINGQFSYEDKLLHDQIDEPAQTSVIYQYIDSIKVFLVGYFRDRLVG